MIIKKLEVAGLRAFKQAEFEFQPGMNLLVGVNGVGKTTVLDALRFCLSKILPEITASRSPKLGFETSDIKVGLKSMKVSCDFEYKSEAFNLLLNKQLESVKPNVTETPREASTKKRSREMREVLIENKTHSSQFTPIDNPDVEIIQPELTSLYPNSKKSNEQPIGVFYSTRRSIFVDQKVSGASLTGGQAAAFAESFSINRNFNLREFAEWFRAQEVLGEESPKAVRHLGVVREAVKEFLPGCQNLHVVTTDRGLDFKIEKEDVTLSVSQLSDGERSVLAMVLDLARRLALANPKLDEPLKDGKGIVLIDELDLHLHPKWQRTVVHNFTRTFPKCQFIATSHSPQIIGEIDEDRIQILADGKCYKPNIAFGVDSNRILEELMDTDSRNNKTKLLIEELFTLIDEEKLKEAKSKLSDLKNMMGRNDPEVIRAQTLIDFLED